MQMVINRKSLTDVNHDGFREVKGKSNQLIFNNFSSSTLFLLFFKEEVDGDSPITLLLNQKANKRKLTEVRHCSPNDLFCSPCGTGFRHVNI